MVQGPTEHAKLQAAPCCPSSALQPFPVELPLFSTHLPLVRSYRIKKIIKKINGPAYFFQYS